MRTQTPQSLVACFLASGLLLGLHSKDRPATVRCRDGRSDAGAIQAAVNAGGTVVISGACAVRGNTIHINNPVTINGPATLVGNQSQVFQLNSNSVTINGLTINYGYVSSGGNIATIYSNFTFTNNTIQHLWSAGPSGGPTALSANGGLTNSNISGNTFFDIWGGGAAYPNAANPPTACCSNTGATEAWGSKAVQFYSLNQTTISNNVFSEIGNDALALSFESTIGNAGGSTTSGVVIAYNKFDHVRRIPIEIQGETDGGCPGGCNFSLTPTTGLQIKGNYVHDYTPYSFYDTWGSSLVPDGAVGSQYLNNTFIADPGSYSPGYGGYAACMESSGRNNLVQGNICASIAGAASVYGKGISEGNGSNPTYTSTYQNNIFCGAGKTTELVIESPTSPARNSTMVDQHNYKNANACPAGANLTASSIAAAFVGSPSLSGSNETWNIAVSSNLSVMYVQFFLDSSTTPIATQELADLNPTFAKDHKWLYHLKLDTAAIKGKQKVTALVSDVSGGKTSISVACGPNAQ